MCRHELLADVEAKAQSRDLTPRRVPRSEERRENLLPLPHGDAGPLVRDRNGGGVFLTMSRHGDRDLTIWRAVLDGVADQVVDHLIETIGIPEAGDACRAIVEGQCLLHFTSLPVGHDFA